MHPHYVVPLFSMHWFLGIVLTFLVFGSLIWLGRKALELGFELKFRYLLAGIFIIREVFLFAYIVRSGLFTFQDSLPLHFCGISYIILVFFLIQPKAFLFEFLLMLSLGGAIQSFVTPELTHGYSPYFIIDYYFSHGAIIFVPLYAIFVFKMKPRHKSWIRVWLFGNLVLGLVYLLNLALESNYIYLMRAPDADNPLILHPYPMHLIGFQIFGLLHILLFYWLGRKVHFQTSAA